LGVTLTNLDGLPVVLGRSASVGYILPVHPAEEVNFDGVLRHPVLKLVEELTAAGQVQGPLVQLGKSRASRYPHRL